MRAVLLVDDFFISPADPDFTASRWPKHAQTEYSVAAALRMMGCSVAGVGARVDLDWTMKRIAAHSPDFVFNLVEEVGGNRKFDSLIVQMLELMGIAYTGASSDVLILTRNKKWAKLVVAEVGVEVPKGVVIGSDLRFPAALDFPAILKPMNQDGSDGVTKDSYVKSAEELRKRLPKFKQWAPLLCEEYIPGRELIVTLSGAKSVSVDSICEMVFPPKSPVKFATNLAKFDGLYRKRFDIAYRTPTYLEPGLRARVVAVAKKAYKALAINAYAKLEFRVDGDRIVFIEANSNSQLNRFAKSTDFGSIGYDKFIKKIVHMALNREG